MGKTYDTLDEKLISFIEKQRMFFVATAPLSADGHVNLSPKGYDAFHVIDGTTVAWLDLGGSGIETQAHVQENGRITIMFCAFEGPANILRLYGQGKVINPHHDEFDDMLALFPGFDRARGIFRVKVSRIYDSCGWGVPFYEFKGERDQLNRFIENKTKEEWLESRYENNAESIDGLPGLVTDLAKPDENTTSLERGRALLEELAPDMEAVLAERYDCYLEPLVETRQSVFASGSGSATVCCDCGIDRARRANEASTQSEY